MALNALALSLGISHCGHNYFALEKQQGFNASQSQNGGLGFFCSASCFGAFAYTKIVLGSIAEDLYLSHPDNFLDSTFTKDYRLFEKESVTSGCDVHQKDKGIVLYRFGMFFSPICAALDFTKQLLYRHMAL